MVPSTGHKPERPLSGKELSDLYFLDARSKLLDIAAYLDRLDRADSAEGDDFRVKALREAIARVATLDPDRARAVQLIFSDPTTELLESAAGLKGAHGAWPGTK